MTTTPLNNTNSSNTPTRRPRKRSALILAAIAGGLMFAGVPSITQAAPRGDRDNNRSRQTQRHDKHDNHNNRGNRSRADRHSNHNNRRSADRHDHRHHDSHSKGSFNLSFLFGGPRVVRSHTAVTRVYVAGHWTTTVIPAVYETHYDNCGHPIQVLVRPAQSQRVWIPGHYSDHCTHGCCTSGGAHSHITHNSTARISIGGRF